MKLSEMQRRNDFQLFDAAYRFHLALLGNQGLTEKSFESNQQSAQERYWDMAGAKRPWEGVDYTERKQKEFTSYRQDYIDAFGVDPADPGFKQWEEARIRELRDTEEEYQETAEEAVIRKLREKA